MMKYKDSHCCLLVAALAIVTLFSCNSSADVPFPTDKLSFAEPVILPLVFDSSKTLHWDTSRSGGINLVTKKLDIDALPSIPYDSSGFTNFTAPPDEAAFDFNALPSANFSLDKLESKSLELKISAMEPPAISKTLPAILQKEKPLAIYDFGLAQGLPTAFISALYTDSKGSLWIGSQGLYRYDGGTLQTVIPPTSAFALVTGITEDNAGNIWYAALGQGIGRVNSQDGSKGSSDKILPVSNSINMLTKDADGNIWLFNSKDSAISIIDPVTLTYKNFDTKNGLSGNWAFQVLQDKDQNIWISTFFKGVTVIDPTAGKIKYLRQANGLLSDSTSAIAMDNKGQIWIAQPHGLAAIDSAKKIIRHYGQKQGLIRNPFSFIIKFDSRGNIWRSTLDGLGGGNFEVINPENKSRRGFGKADGLNGGVGLSILADRFGRVWLGTNGGLNYIDQFAATVHPLGTTQVISLMEDATNNLWVATNGGLYIVNAQRTAMRLLNKSHGLVHDNVQSFSKAGNKMLVATNGGFSIIDPVNKTIQSAGKNEGLESDSLYSIFSDRDGMLWLTGPRNGVDKYDPIKKIFFHADKAAGLSDNNVQDIKQDNEGLIWLATSKRGVDVIDPATGSVKNLHSQPGLSDTCNRVLMLDKEGRMWIGTDKGIYVADKKNNTLACISTAQGLSNNAVLSLLPYKNMVLAGTRYKVNIITAPPAGQPTAKWSVALLDKSENLIKETNSWATDCITHSGQYLWGDNGISVIQEIKPNKDTAITLVSGISIMTQPQKFVNAAKTNQDSLPGNNQIIQASYASRDIYRWDSVSGPYNMPVNLTIPYNNNYLQFQFAQANTGRQDTIFYNYLLEGIDKNWSNKSTNTITENYLNLPAGKYTFKVSSTGVNGQWGPPASFSFTISPPWYKSWWAYSLFALLCIALLRVYIVYRSRKLKRENRLLEEKIHLRTKQLEASIEDLKTTQTQLIQAEKMASLGELTAGIAHEIQNPLNFVNNFSELNTELLQELNDEIDKGNYEDVKALANDVIENEKKINHHGKRADAIVKGMLQHSRSSNGLKEPTDINAVADEYLRLSYHGLRAKDKSFNASMKTDFNPDLPKINIVSQDVGRVILNLFTNAFYSVSEKKKAAAPEDKYEPTVGVSTRKINLQNGNEGIEVKIEDNGLGVPQKVLDKIFQPFFTTKPVGQGTGLGLSLSYDIIKAHNGELKVENREGEGAAFIIHLPINA